MSARTSHRGRALSGAVALVAMTSVVAACSSSGSGPSSTGSASKSAGTSTQGIKLAFVSGVTGDNFYDTEACGAKQAAAAAGASVAVSGPGQYDPAEQATVAQTAASSGAKALLIAPTSPTVLEPPVQAAKGQGMKIVAVGDTFQDSSLANATILTNNNGGGTLAGQALDKDGSGSGPVLIISVEAGNPVIGQRVSGFQAALKQDGKLTPLPVQYDDNKATSAETIVRSTLAAHPNLAGVFATDLPGLTGAAEGLKSAGKEGKISLVGYDASPSEVALLKSGAVQALVAQPAKQEGAQAVTAALALLAGKSVPSLTTLPNHLLTASNLDTDSQYVYSGAC